MVKSWRVQLWVLAVLALSCVIVVGGACSVSRGEGEYGVGVCSDHADNDNDGMADCRDPDCQPEDVCGRASPLKEPDSGPAEHPPTAGDPALPPAFPGPDDAGVTDPPSPPMTDAQVSEPPSPDASAPEPPDDPPPVVECTPACASNATCIEGFCVPNEAVFVEVWDVVSVSVQLPRKDSNGMCLDPPYVCVRPEPLAICDCAPDPMVRVAVKRPGEEPKVAFETKTVLGTDEHVWEVKEQLLLRKEFEIVLTAFDADGLLAEPVFSCSVLAEPETLGTGLVSCGRKFRESLLVETDAKVTLRVRPAPSSTP